MADLDDFFSDVAQAEEEAKLEEKCEPSRKRARITEPVIAPTSDEVVIGTKIVSGPKIGPAASQMQMQMQSAPNSSAFSVAPAPRQLAAATFSTRGASNSNDPYAYNPNDMAKIQQKNAVAGPSIGPSMGPSSSSQNANPNTNPNPTPNTNPNPNTNSKSEKPQDKTIRYAAGKTWKDETLDEWPENDWRIFVGDLSKDVDTNMLAAAFRKYKTFARAKVIYDKVKGKSKGFGFVSFLDSSDCAKALREMNDAFIGNRPIKVKRSDWQERDLGTHKKNQKKQAKQRKQMFG